MMFWIDFAGACVTVFCWASIGHAPKQYNTCLIIGGALGLLPLVISVIVAR